MLIMCTLDLGYEPVGLTMHNPPPPPPPQKKTNNRAWVHFFASVSSATRVGVKYSTCTWYLYLSTYLSVLDVFEYLVYRNVKVLVLVLLLDQKVLGT